ncbi:MAG: hypothetical protein H0W64_01285 [Gammaproteobacteria bacterium]|nr:hypothetical protein [Gammaproteobacteria bacterium]
MMHKNSKKDIEIANPQENEDLNLLTPQFPDELIIEPINKENKEMRYTHYQRRSDIGNAGWDKFMTQLQSLDPSGDFTNWLDVVEPQYSYQYVHEKICLKKNLTLPSGDTIDLYLQPSAIINLAGEIFSSTEEPISSGNNDEEQQSRFTQAYNNLIDPGKYQKMQKFLETSFFNPEQNDLIFKKSMTADSLQYDLIRNEGNLGVEFCDNHLNLTTHNLDHFGTEAFIAFTAGLSIAHSKAAAAKENDDKETRKALLTEALTYALFACHFLTDIYTAGHINVPQREILNAMNGDELSSIPRLGSSTKILMSSLLVKQMHGECHEKPVKLKPKSQPYRKKNPYRWGNLNQENEGSENQYNNDGEGCDEQYDFSSDQACNAIALALYDIYLIYTGNLNKEVLFLDSFQQTFSEIYEQENNLNKNPLFSYSKERNDISMNTDEGYKPLPSIKNTAKLSTLIGVFYNFKTKNTAQRIKELNNNEVEELLENLENAHCKFR